MSNALDMSEESWPQWWAMRAWNSETRYGFGTNFEARWWAERLNAGREVNRYAPEPAPDDVAADLDAGRRNDGVFIVDELEP